MTSNYGNRRLTAFFDRRDEAERAMSELRALGISESSMRLTGGEETTGRLSTAPEPGFWESIGDFFFPPADRDAYEEGLRRGGFLLTVGAISEDLYDRAVDILDAEGSVDIDERSESWRSEGWAGATSTGVAAAPAAPGMSTAEAYAARDTGATGTQGVLAGEGSGSMSARSDLEGEEVIPIVEERLRVGKRDANLGRVRVRSYVVEEPVSEDVSLRQERVEIERRPVERLAGSGDFVDRTIEAEEHAEEAVVSKEARVTEEVGLRREGEERTETISDTVRRTEVEIEDDRDALDRDTNRRGA